MWFEEYIEGLSRKLNIQILYTPAHSFLSPLSLGVMALPRHNRKLKAPMIVIRKTKDEPWRVFFHELSHYSGLFLPNRDVDAPLWFIKQETISREETIAEMTSMKLMAILGIQTRSILEDQIDYIRSYNCDVDVSREVNEAVQYILTHWVDVNEFRQTGKAA